MNPTVETELEHDGEALDKVVGQPTAVDGGADEGEEEIKGPTGPAAIGSKKKKKRKPKSKKMPSGFEEFFSEKPLTKEEFEEELELYSMKRPFTERIEYAIQRYRAKRKHDGQRLSVFDNYLVLGGISTSQKSFAGGIDNAALEEMDSQQISTLVAKDAVPEEILNSRNKPTSDDEEQWEVDFAHVVKAFLSYKLPFIMCVRDVAQLKDACMVIRNFLNYLVYHNVATEYDGNVREAIEITKVAETELAQCQYFARRLPGRFNTACSTYFGGFYKGLNDAEKTSWMDEEMKKALPRAGFTEEEAKQVLRFVFESTNPIFPQEYKDKGFKAKLVKTQEIGATVVGIEEPPFDAPGKNLALGKLRLKIWNPREENEWETNLDEFDFYVEKEAVQFAFEGMHFEGTLHTLDTGLHYLDNLTSCQTSFYTEMDDPHFEGNDDMGDLSDVEPVADEGKTETTGAE